MFKEITVKSALHYHDTKFAANWDLNIYRGCEHRCRYCYAQYSHDYLNENGAFFDDIFVKINIAEVLDKELNRKTWKNDLINIAGVCDCYQPAEEKYKLMRKVLNVLIKHKQQIFILTKSPLILRDYDLIDELSKKTFVNVAMTITTFDEDIRKKIEPNTCSSVERFDTLKKFTKLNCRTTLMFMPIIPYLNDDINGINNIYKLASEAGINNVISAPLNLRGSLKTNFFNFLKEEFPSTHEKIQHLYKTAYVKKEYSEKLANFINKLKQKYKFRKFNASYLNNIGQQLDLFK